MAVTISSLIQAYPEFENSRSPAQIESAISRAERRVDETVLGDRYDDCVMLYACHLLAISSHGFDMRYEGDRNYSPYWDEANRLIRQAGAAYRVIA